MSNPTPTTLADPSQPDSSQPEMCPRERGAGSRIRNWLLAGAGVVLVGIGAVGVFVPGLPTTIFLIIASWLFTKSCPWLERRMIRNKFFGPYLVYMDGNAPIPRRAKITAICLMWVSVSVSVWLLRETAAGVWLPLGVWAAAVIGTVVIIRHGKKIGATPDELAGRAVS